MEQVCKVYPQWHLDIGQNTGVTEDRKVVPEKHLYRLSGRERYIYLEGIRASPGMATRDIKAFAGRHASLLVQYALL